MKHTKGPWYVSGDEVCADTDKGQAELATVHDECEYQPRLPKEANARLMASAPEMLEALEELMDPSHTCGCDCTMSEPCPIGEKARAAIAKAKGEK
jgi:hypothetical protein